MARTYVALANVSGDWFPIAAARTKQEAWDIATECATRHPGHTLRGVEPRNMAVVPAGKARAVLGRERAFDADALAPGDCVCSLLGLGEIDTLAYTY
jgi:hypothetical protein